MKMKSINANWMKALVVPVFLVSFGASAQEVCGVLEINLPPPYAAAEPDYRIHVRKRTGSTSKNYSLVLDVERGNRRALRELRDGDFACLEGDIVRVKNNPVKYFILSRITSVTPGNNRN